ncbi:MAG: DUF2764 family protein [Paludibacteraceae bacterium]|nr:DUF2764 family protein [Paludibacteraceae bacterium]MBP6284560.1 DUF2764 family protein [Paludibacteraceae bacterium]
MSKNYYALVAGLPDITVQDTKLLYTSVLLRNSILEEVSDEDMSMVQLLFLPFDHTNILNTLFDKKAVWDERGILPQSTVEQLKDKKSLEAVDLEDAPPYIRSFVEDFHTNEQDATYYTAEYDLTVAYYDYLSNYPNKFIQELAHYNISLHNLKVAFNGRKYDIQYDKQLIGDNELTHTLKKSRTRDFGASTLIDDLESLLQTFEVEDILERELKIDIHTWNIVEERTFFNYFSIERVMAFIVKLLIVERWLQLDAEKGKEMFNQIVTELQDGFQFSEEFTLAYGKKK